MFLRGSFPHTAWPSGWELLALIENHVDLGDKTDTGKGRFSSQITCYSQAHSFLHLPRGDEGGIHILKCACSATARLSQVRRILILRRACQMSRFPSFKGESTVAYQHE